MLAPTSRKEHLKAVCKTRWVESSEACVVFDELFESIFAALVTCSQNCSQKDARAKALGFTRRISDPEFIFTIVLLGRVMDSMKILSKELQKVDVDLTLVIFSSF